LSEAPVIAVSAPAVTQGEMTEEFRQQELARGRASFFYFYSAICGFTADDPETGLPTIGDLHREMCEFLESPFLLAVICCFRGAGKSVAVMVYILWRCLYIINFSALILSNSAENAKKLHFLPLIDLLTVSPRAEYLRWLFSHRIPPGLGDTNSEQLDLIRTDPLAPPAITYAGMDSKLEGKHPDLVALDDAEGADAEKSQNASESAMAAWERIQFLPKYPMRSQIILVGTPWGRKPIVWQLRDRVNWQSDADNATSSIKFFWRPIEDANGKPAWPERFPKEIIDTYRRNRLDRSQRWLERDTGEISLFDMEAVRDSAYHWLSPRKDEISYKGFRFDPDKIGSDGYVHPEQVPAVVRMRQLRFFIHMDPLHKTEATRRTPAHRLRPATAAIGVVGVAPDFHAFLIDYWLGDADLAGQAEELFRLYRMYAPMAVTYESIGAQAWLKSHIEMKEQENINWRRPKSSPLMGTQVNLPRLSRRLSEAKKTTESKDWLYRESLSPWMNHGTFHLRLDQNEAIKQLENVLNESYACDLVDLLAQGPPVWKPAASDGEALEFAERRAYVEGFVKRGDVLGRAGFHPPGWRARR